VAAHKEISFAEESWLEIPGSGKTKTIAWTAHFFADLNDASHKKLFDTVPAAPPFAPARHPSRCGSASAGSGFRPPLQAPLLTRRN
jgi:hypothetical protein